jgi:hypothetical protein
MGWDGRCDDGWMDWMDGWIGKRKDDKIFLKIFIVHMM